LSLLNNYWPCADFGAVLFLIAANEAFFAAFKCADNQRLFINQRKLGNFSTFDDHRQTEKW
jgi:hypothetical protein